MSTGELESKDLKVCLLGPTEAGKSSLVVRFVSNIFKDTVTTVGASFMAKTVIVNEKTYKIQIWDTAGQEKYRGLAPMYYRGAVAALLVYDITQRRSFDALKLWNAELKMNGPEDLVIAVVGNKIDLEASRAIPTEEGEKFAESIGALFFETSALTGANIPIVFEAICLDLAQRGLNGPKQTENIVDYAKPPPNWTQKKEACGCQ